MTILLFYVKRWFLTKKIQEGKHVIIQSKLMVFVHFQNPNKGCRILFFAPNNNFTSHLVKIIKNPFRKNLLNVINDPFYLFKNWTFNKFNTIAFLYSITCHVLLLGVNFIFKIIFPVSTPQFLTKQKKFLIENVI